MTNSSENGRTNPRVLILGGGFAGIGAARTLKDADVDVVLVDQHDYHTFQPLLYQLATGLLEHDRRRAFAARPRPRAGQRDRSSRRRHRDRPRGARGPVRAARADRRTTTSCSGSAPRSTSSGPRARRTHAFPMYTLADAVRLNEHVLERWEAADRDPSLVEDGALNVVVVGGGPTGIETAGALAELYRADFAKDYRIDARSRPGSSSSRPGPDIFSMFKPNLREYAEEALEKRTVELMTGRRGRIRLPDPRHAQDGRRPERAHARLGSRPAGQPARPVARARARARQPYRRRARAQPPRTTPRSTRSATSPRSPIRRRARCCRSWGRSRSSPGSTPARRSRGVSRARRRSRSPTRQGHDGDDRSRSRGRPDARRQDDEGLKAQVAWGAVHLALLPTNEDRAKAVVDWAGAAFTHQRAGRITVRHR